MRKSDWEPALAGYIAQHRNAALEWGVLDCAKFAAGAVQAMTGVNPMREFKYRSEAGAWRSLKKNGFASLADAMDAKFPRIPKALAGRGDVVMRDNCLGVCIGAEGLFLPLEGSGLIRVHRRDWSHAWRVS